MNAPAELNPRADYREQKAQRIASWTEALRALGHGRKSTYRIEQALKDLAQLTDHTLKLLWPQALQQRGAALLAVGGYGRAELFPHSDVDVLILLPDDCDPAADALLRETLEGFIGQCWDAGLELGSSVRTLTECLSESAKDVTIQTALLESRRITGSTTLCAALRQSLDQAMQPQAFFTAKILEMRQRHVKHENTPYSLEPHVKESPGGLRDLHTVRWVARAAGLGHNWNDFHASGLLTDLEAKRLRQNEASLSLIRWMLHALTKRREDRLVFDLQHQVAAHLGLIAQVDEQRQARAASEALMRTYYWAAKAVTQLSEILLLNLESRLEGLDSQAVAVEPINERFNNRAGLLDIANDALYFMHPSAILETFLVYQTTSGVKGFSARTLRALYNARPIMDAQFRSQPEHRALFLDILRAPQGITHAMRLMNQTSVLGRYLWPFRRVVGQMQHDLFHVYTVDQHILMVLRNVRRFFIPEHAHEYPFCSQLAAGWDKPELLYIAALFHDIGKGRGGDHSVIGKAEVRRFAKSHGLSKEDADLVVFLVGEHLTMSHVAQKQDLSDPEVIQAFAKRVRNERWLRGLYLLTVADIRGTSPKVWNAWKGKLLEDLYRYTVRALGGGMPDPEAMVEQRKREAIQELALHALPARAHEPLWKTLDVGYFMRHDASDIAWHTRQLSRALAQAQQDHNEVGVIVRARLSALGEGLEVMVYSPDQPDLFARICGFFDQADLSILDAKVHTTSNGYALDTFQVVTGVEDVHHRELINGIETGLAHTLSEPGELPQARTGRVSRRVKSFPITPRVTLQPDEKAQRWLLTLSASDRPGLLYRIASVLAKHRINLNQARIATLGERVEDTLVVDGAALQHNRSQLELETELLQALRA
ncbi:MAG: [protein-PII] uridylyltransferase [Betaproteobacteria bacterium]|jgi:[protein-PII] uridylyltransferase|nr:[protein-PII] uridylyltransferase [Betaproteobacteria bacterium]NBP44954.1 [protein-PII] uridylyltransferase [Betaproteobacteria bacterium]